MVRKSWVLVTAVVLLCTGVLTVGAMAVDVLHKVAAEPSALTVQSEAEIVGLAPTAIGEANTAAAVVGEEASAELTNAGASVPKVKKEALVSNTGEPLGYIIASHVSLNPPVGGRACAFDLSPGTAAPPDTLCGYMMTPFADDPRPTLEDVDFVESPCGWGQIDFSIPLNHRKIGDGWNSWSHGYTGDVYYSNGAASVTITLPPGSCAFYFYVEPNPYDVIQFTAETADGTSSGSFSADGQGGAAYVGVCCDDIQTVTISTDDGVTDFAIGEFGIACYCEPVFGACCDYEVDPDTCTNEVAPGDCTGPYKRWALDEDCDEWDCDHAGACCVEETCHYLDPYECDQLGGEYLGDGTTCDPNPCLCADHWVDAPGGWTGTTCGAGDDCDLRSGEEVIYAVNIPTAGTWAIDLCGSTYDTYLFVGTSCCGAELGSIDDYCGLQSYLEVTVGPGTIYVDIEGYGGCGDYDLQVYQIGMGACCVETECVGDMFEPECTALGGDHFEGESCDTFVCPGGCPESDIWITVVTDPYPSETTWQLTQQPGGTVIATGGPYSSAGTTYFHEVCVTDDGCYDFTIYDSYGDGIYSPGGYEVAFNGTVVYSCIGSGWDGREESVLDIGGCIFAGACCEDTGCTNDVLEADCAGHWVGAFTECGDGSDCDGDGWTDYCEIAMGDEQDCNENGIPDSCDIAEGTSTDCQPNGIPDECEADCNENGIADECDIADCDTTTPFEEHAWCLDCQPDGIPDGCQLGGDKGDKDVLWDNGLPNGDNAMACQFGGQVVDAMVVDDFELTSGATINDLHWYTSEQPAFTWSGQVRVEVYPDSGGAPDESGGATAALWVPVDGGAVTRTYYGPSPSNPSSDGYIYDLTEINITLGPGIWWIGMATAGDEGGSGQSFWEVSHSDADVVMSETYLRSPITFGVASFTPFSVLAGTPPYDASFTITSTGGAGGGDCNGNLIPDDCDIEGGTSVDCQPNGIPDECEPDCQPNGIADECDIRDCDPDDPDCQDCNGDGIPDSCNIADCDEEENWCQDCQPNGVPDMCDIESEASTDCNDNGIPDDCECLNDCDGDGAPDICDPDCDGNDTSDVCDMLRCGLYDPHYDCPAGNEYAWCHDCNDNGILDACDAAAYKGRGEGVMYAPTEDDDAALRQAISDALGGAPCDYYDARAGTPTVAEMEAYAAVYTWVNYAYSDNVMMGDNLADFADGGGVVVLGQWTLCTAGNCLSGRIMTEAGYNPATATTATSASSDYAGDGVSCIHEGVTAYTASYRDDISAVAGAITDGTWTDGQAASAMWEEGPSVYYRPGSPHAPYGATGEHGLVIANMTANCGGGEGAGDCNGNCIPDDCDITAGTSGDCNENDIPDECEPDCNSNGTPDDCDVEQGGMPDCNGNLIPDECEVPPICPDCPDCQPDGVPDECQLDPDCNGDEVPDECQLDPDCNGNGVPDDCDLFDCDREQGRDELYCQHVIPGDEGVGAGGLLATGSDLVQGYTAVDNFTLEDGAGIETVQWQNLYFSGASDCPDVHYVEIRFYADVSGAPGDLLATYTDVPHTKALHPRPWVFDTYPVYDCVGTLEPAFNAEAGVSYWVAVIGDPTPCAGTLGWMASPDAPPGDASYYQDTGTGWAWSDADLAFCLFGASGPPCNDCNENGIPDDCELCGDLDGDEDVDYTDYTMFLAAFGEAADGDPVQDYCCDYDDSGVVGLGDYQTWIQCYRDFIGDPLAGPPSGPQPEIEVAPTVRPAERAPGLRPRTTR